MKKQVFEEIDLRGTMPWPIPAPIKMMQLGKVDCKSFITDTIRIE